MNFNIKKIKSIKKNYTKNRNSRNSFINNNNNKLQHLAIKNLTKRIVIQIKFVLKV